MKAFKDLANEYKDFLVPQYEISIGAAGGSVSSLPKLRAEDYPVLSITVNQSVGPASSAEIVFACPYNYESSDFTQNIFKKLEPGNMIAIKLGYDKPKTVFVGALGTMNVSYIPSGITVGITCYDAKMALFYNTRWKSFKKNSKMQDVVKEILKPCEKYGKVKVTELGYDKAVERGQEIPWKQDNIDDYQFLIRLAELTNASFYTNGDTVYFGENIIGSAEKKVKLGWGKGLMSFSVDVDISGQVGSVEIAYRDTKREVDYFVYDGSSVKGDGKRPDTNVVSDKTHEKTEPLVKNAKQAELAAKSIYLSSAMNYVRARGSTIGIPDIKAGTAIELTDLGKRLDSTYFLSQVTHQYDAGGYLTSFIGQKAKF